MINIKTICVVDGGISLNDGSDFTTVLFEELSSPISDISESLDRKSFTFNSKRFISALIDERLSIEEFSDAVVDTKTSGLSSTGNTSLGDIFSSAASQMVNVGFTPDLLIGILDPRHNLLVGSHVWTEAID